MPSAYRLPYDLQDASKGKLLLSDIQLSKPQAGRQAAHLGNHATLVRNETESSPTVTPPLASEQHPHPPGPPPSPSQWIPSYSWLLRIMPSPSQSAAAAPANPSAYRPPCTAQI